MTRGLGVLLVGVVALCIGGWLMLSPGVGYTSINGEAFATRYRITFAQGPDAGALQQAVDAELARIDAMASTWRDDSELMRYNRAAEPGAFALSPELAGLIEQARRVGAQTGGAFSLRPGSGDIDLSAIAKGYAVDRVVAVLRDQFGVSDCMVDIGGEVRVVGSGPNGGGWRVGLYAPNSAADTYGIDAPVLELRDTSVATSGSYFKGGHILDPSTGKPVDNQLLSASAIHPSSATADALATALFVMGPDKGMAWAQDHGVHVLFLLKDGTRLEHNPDATAKPAPAKDDQ